MGSRESSPKFAEDLENTEDPLNMKILENFQKFVEILLFLYSFLEIPRGPRGIDFIFLDPRGM